MQLSELLRVKAFKRFNILYLYDFLYNYNCGSYIYNHITQFLDGWRCDQYRWTNQGVTKLPRGKCVIWEMYFVADIENGINKEFQMNAFQLIV